MSYTRFAIYYVPPAGDLARFGAQWLGWDVVTGQPVNRFDITGLDDVTMTPRKYGFHGTLKPPFRLAAGCGPDDLQDAVAGLVKTLAPASCDGLRLSRLGHFLALTPKGNTTGLARVAAACVMQLDGFRAPPSDAELVRRRKAGLNPAQDAYLQQYGYPYVLDEFRFHLTLTGALDTGTIAAWESVAAAHLPALPAPFSVASVALTGERADGRFELIQRYPLAG